MTQRTAFSETRLYPVVFMIIITMIFVGILATFYLSTQERVQAYRDMVLKTTILRLFELPTADVETTFAQFIQPVMAGGMQAYKATAGDSLLGWCVPISGSGLWSTIHAMVALSPQADRILKMEITDQNETPRLGGRITESWFTGQFSGRMLLRDGQAIRYGMMPEGEPVGRDEVNQVTGATASSKAVVDMLYSQVQAFRQKLSAGGLL
jgi:Na+-transporting NADH:ubiquinone oxidoreductase subunit C